MVEAWSVYYFICELTTGGLQVGTLKTEAELGAERSGALHSGVPFAVPKLFSPETLRQGDWYRSERIEASILFRLSPCSSLQQCLSLDTTSHDH